MITTTDGDGIDYQSIDLKINITAFNYLKDGFIIV
jgi:hypothetical protein